MRPLQVAKQMWDQVSGIGPDPSEGGRGEVALFGQADEVQTGHLAGPPIALHHLAGFVHHGQAFEKGEIGAKTGGKQQSINGFMPSICPDDTR